MEIILIVFLLIILILISYLIFGLFKKILEKRTRVYLMLTLIGGIILVSIINNVFLKKTEFFPLASETYINNGNIHQHIVITNPSRNLDSLAVAIKRYSKSNSNFYKIIEKDDYLRVFFYKETWDTPRDFKSTDDDCNFGSEYIGCHTDDIISVLEKDTTQKNKWKFQVRKNSDSEWINYPFKVKCIDE